jgi:hypothetical protein
MRQIDRFEHLVEMLEEDQDRPVAVPAADLAREIAEVPWSGGDGRDAQALLLRLTRLAQQGRGVAVR